MSVVTHQHQRTGNEEVDEVPKQGREPKIGHIDPADKLHVLGLDGSLADQQEREGAGQGSHPIEQVNSNGEPSLASKGTLKQLVSRGKIPPEQYRAF